MNRHQKAFFEKCEAYFSKEASFDFAQDSADRYVPIASGWRQKHESEKLFVKQKT